MTEEKTQTDMARMLSLLNQAAVARRLGVKRQAVSSWAASDDPPPARVAQVAELLLGALAPNGKTAPPDYWARRLREDAAAISALLLPADEAKALDVGESSFLAPLAPDEKPEDPAEDAPGTGRPRNRRGR